MADYGLQIWDASGAVIFNSSKGCARMLGSFIPSVATGEMIIATPLDGQPVVNLFAFSKTSTASFQYTFTRPNTVTYRSIWTEGNVIKWRDLIANAETSRIFYGDSYL